MTYSRVNFIAFYVELTWTELFQFQIRFLKEIFCLVPGNECCNNLHETGVNITNILLLCMYIPLKLPKTFPNTCAFTNIFTLFELIIYPVWCMESGANYTAIWRLYNQSRPVSGLALATVTTVFKNSRKREHLLVSNGLR